jgi:lipopolysaccharide cholinephosphotransferase
MADLQMEKLHRMELMICDELDRICKKNDIPYFMIAGTLLGAIRHHGFIPWDEDMDFGMMRQDYERFVKACETDLNTNVFFLQTMDSDAHYPKAFAKLRIKGTHIKENEMKNCDCMDGIFIDLFPFDYVPDDPAKQKKAQRERFLWNAMFDFKCGIDGIVNHRESVRKAMKVMSHFFSRKTMMKKKKEIYTRDNDEKTKFIVTAQGSYGYFKEIIPVEYTKKLVYYPFEDMFLPGFEDYDSYLSGMYKDYMQVPPENSRNKHVVLDVDFGKYKNDPRFEV